MRKSFFTVTLMASFLNFAVGQDIMDKPIQQLIIRWQRFIGGQDETTCERCNNTQGEIAKAYDVLKQTLAPLGIDVILKDSTLGEKTFSKNPQESNRIWIGEKSLEDWLGAKIGATPCASCCDIISKDIECRTIQFEGKAYETIPSFLIIRAGLMAAAQMVKMEPDKPAKPCCSDQVPGQSPCESCPKKN